MSKRDLGMGLLVAFLWGINFIAIKLGLANMPPLFLATIRFTVLCIPAIFFVPKPPIPWKWLIALGMTLNVGQFAFLFMGVKMGMPAGLSSLVHQSQVFFTLLIATWMLGEKWERHHIIGLVVAFFGMAVVGSQQGGSMTAIGFWLTLIAASSWGAGNVVMRRATRGVPPYSMLALVIWAGAVAILPLGILSYVVEGVSAWSLAFKTIDGVTIGSILYLAYVSSLIGYALWGGLLSRYPAAVVAPFSLLVPVVGMSSTFFFLNETLNLTQVMGALLVMAGLAINVFGKHLKIVPGYSR